MLAEWEDADEMGVIITFAHLVTTSSLTVLGVAQSCLVVAGNWSHKEGMSAHLPEVTECHMRK